MTFTEPDWWGEWTYFDEEELITKLKTDAPDDIQKEWEEIMSVLEEYYNRF